MNNIGILKAAHHMYNGIHLSDIGKKLVAKALSLAGSLYKSRDIHKLNGGRRYLFCMVKVSKLFNPLIRYGYNSHIGVNRTKGVVGGFCSCLGERVK